MNKKQLETRNIAKSGEVLNWSGVSPFQLHLGLKVNCSQSLHAILPPLAVIPSIPETRLISKANVWGKIKIRKWIYRRQNEH